MSASRIYLPLKEVVAEKQVQAKIGDDTYFTHLTDGWINIATKNGYVELCPEEITELLKFLTQ